jgi:hypothetical protein
MATQRVGIFQWTMKPDNTGDAYPEPHNVNFGANDLADPLLLILEDTSTDIGVYGSFRVPPGYVDTANLVVTWSTTATTGDWRCQFNYRAVGGDDTESLDPSTWQETVEANDTAPSAAREKMTVSISLTDGNFAAGDSVLFYFVREGSDTINDDLAASVYIFEAEFEYADA